RAVEDDDVGGARGAVEGGLAIGGEENTGPAREGARREEGLVAIAGERVVGAAIDARDLARLATKAGSAMAVAHEGDARAAIGQGAGAGDGQRRLARAAERGAADGDDTGARAPREGARDRPHRPRAP